MKRWDKESDLRVTERLSLPLFFFFAVIHPSCKHALGKESTIKRSVDNLELFDDQRRGFRQLSSYKHRVYEKRCPK